jgi:uncharacterized protein (TIGR03000 family)
MRRWLCSATIVAVTTLGLLMLPARSEAQRGGRAGGGARAGGARVSGSRGAVRVGGVGVAWGPRGWAVGVGGRGWYPGWRGGWYAGGGWGRPVYAYGYGPSYVYDVYPGTAYYYPPPVSYVYDEPPPQGRVSGYLEPYQPGATEADDEQAGNVARVTVRVPANATLYFNGARMVAGGTTRTFTTPPLETGYAYHYDVKVRMPGNAPPTTRVLNVRAGQNYNLDFNPPQRASD